MVLRLTAFALLLCLMIPSARAQTVVDEDRVEDLLEQMTLEEKIGQMTQLTLQELTREKAAAAAGPTAVDGSGEGGYLARFDPEKLREAVVDHHLGSVLNVVDHALPIEHWHELIGQLQEVATEETRLGIPVVYGIDAVHGANYLIGGTVFPHNIGLAASFDTELVKRANEITAFETRASGIPWNFSPVMDLGRQPLWGRFYETFGEDVLVARRMGRAAVEGMQGNDLESDERVAATAKHFVGYSVPKSGKDRTTAYIPDRILREYHLPPFQAAIDADVLTVMVNSGDVNGVPVHASHYLLTEVLRDEMGFEGVVVTDWEDIIKLHRIHHVARDTREATRMAVEAGIDMAMVPYDFSFYDDLLALVQDGVISEERIDQSVRRILRMKEKLGLFESATPPPVGEEVVHTDDFREAAREAARRTLTLLENDGTLPLAEGQKILVTGPTAQSLTALNGGWTYTWQGTDDSRFPEDKLTVFEAMQARFGEENVIYAEGSSFDEEADLAEAVAAAEEADVVVVALGENAYAEKVGDLDDLKLPEAQQALVRELSATGKPIVAVLVAGRPRLLGEIPDQVDAVLMAYWPGMEGGPAIADVLSGDVNPSGRLPYSFPRSAHDLLAYDHPYSSSFGMWLDKQIAYRPQWPFGHGLSYTSFEYEDLELAETVTPDETVQAAVTVRNTGERTGRETVLLYIGDEYATVAPPVRRLRDFEVVELAPGETQRVVFEVDPQDLAFVDEEGTWTLEPGQFRVEVGGLEGSFQLVANGQL